MFVVSSKTVAMVEMGCTSKRNAEVVICLKPFQKPSIWKKRVRDLQYLSFGRIWVGYDRAARHWVLGFYLSS